MKVAIALLILMLPGATFGQMQARPAQESRAGNEDSLLLAQNPAAAGATGQCQKLCANDFSPCDPIYFKTEDGRCAGIPTR